MPPRPTWPSASVEFRVDGVPRPQQRCRFAGHVYDPSAKDHKAFRDRSRPHCPFVEPPPGPVTIVLEFVMVRPKSHLRTNGALKDGAPRQHQAAPDVDNLAKLVLDALNCLFYADDRQVTQLTTRKRYAEAGELAGTIVSIRYGMDCAVAWQVALQGSEEQPTKL